jgi:glycosyltransferase involved in cell wall biosynthesis
MSESRVIPPLRIAVLGDFEGMHTRRWLEVFVQRGHEVHAISYYRPNAELQGVTLHVLAGSSAPFAHGGLPPSGADMEEALGAEGRAFGRGVRRLVPPSLQRLAQARRYMNAGLRHVLDEVKPDVFHAHYAVEHGFYGSFADFHPYIVSAWGSDLLVESRKPLGRMISRRALSQADLVTANDVSLGRRARELGVPEDRVEVVHLGIDRLFLEAGEQSVNLRSTGGRPPTVISDRALEPLYNVDVVLRAFARVRDRSPEAGLIVAGDGSQIGELQRLAQTLGLGTAVQFVGRQTSQQLAVLLAAAHVYVSVPSSDSLALSTVEAMASGAFPVVSDLPSNEGWMVDGVNGLVVSTGDVSGLAEALHRALRDSELRRSAAAPSRAKVEAEGLRERNMLLMERHYYRLAGHPQAGGGEAI